MDSGLALPALSTWFSYCCFLKDPRTCYESLVRNDGTIRTTSVSTESSRQNRTIHSGSRDLSHPPEIFGKVSVPGGAGPGGGGGGGGLPVS